MLLPIFPRLALVAEILGLRVGLVGAYWMLYCDAQHPARMKIERWFIDTFPYFRIQCNTEQDQGWSDSLHSELAYPSSWIRKQKWHTLICPSESARIMLILASVLKKARKRVDVMADIAPDSTIIQMMPIDGLDVGPDFQAPARCDSHQIRATIIVVTESCVARDSEYEAWSHR